MFLYVVTYLKITNVLLSLPVTKAISPLQSFFPHFTEDNKHVLSEFSISISFNSPPVIEQNGSSGVSLLFSTTKQSPSVS